MANNIKSTPIANNHELAAAIRLTKEECNHLMKRLFDSLKLGQTLPIYLLYGEEEYLIEQAIARISALVSPQADSWNRETLAASDTSPDEAVALAQDMGFFQQRRLIIVRHIEQWLGKKGSNGKADTALGRLIAYAADPNPDNILLLVMSGNPDKRTKLYQAIQKGGRAVAFPLLKSGEREIWLGNYLRRQGKRASQQVLRYLCLAVGGGLQQLHLEADKLILYADAQNTTEITMEAAQTLTTVSSEYSLFDLCDATANGSGAKAQSIYRQLLLAGEAEQKILVMLANQFRNILAIKDLLANGYSLTDAAQKLSLHPYAAEKNARAARGFRQGALIKALEILLAADIANKHGEQPLRESLETAILRIALLAQGPARQQEG